MIQIAGDYMSPYAPSNFDSTSWKIIWLNFWQPLFIWSQTFPPKEFLQAKERYCRIVGRHCFFVGGRLLVNAAIAFNSGFTRLVKTNAWHQQSILT